VIERILKNKLVILGGLILFVYFYKDRWGNITLNKAYLTAGVIFLLILAIDGMNKGWKQESPQIVAPNFHASWGKDIEPAGIYYILIRAGGILAQGFHMLGRDGTVILDVNHTYQGDNCIITSLILKKVPLSHLPSEVAQEIKMGKYPEPYYFGDTIATDLNQVFESTEDPQILKQKITTLRSTNQWLVEANEMLKEEIDNLLSHIKRVTGKDDQWWKAMFRKQNEGEEL